MKKIILLFWIFNFLQASILLDYRMDECYWDGTVDEVKDSSLNKIDATSLNDADTETNSTLSGMIGRVGDFKDGNYALLSSINLPETYTITMWLKFPLDETNHKIFREWRKRFYYFNIADIKGTDNEFIYFKKSTTNSQYICIKGSEYDCQTYNFQNLNGWHFITFKISNNDTKFYVDNQLKIVSNQHPNYANLTLLFNSDYKTDDNIPNGQSIGAYVDEFKIFNGLLLDNDLENIYNNELNRKNYDGTKRENINCDGKLYQICYQTNFSNQVELDQNWTIIKQQNYTPKVVDKKLRLTTNSGDIAAGLTLKNKVFKANGTKFKIKFKHYAYNGSSQKGADGIAVVFSDANITPVAGAFGGSLGYAQRTTPNEENGFAGGWIGIGLDEYGNYSNDNEGRVGGIGFTPQAVAIRGSYLEEYKYLIGTNSLNSPISNGYSIQPAPGYTYEIAVDTTQQNKTIISVYRDTGNGNEVLINNYEYSSSNTPEYFRFSITGSTGGENNIHEIDDLEILAIDCNTTLVKPPVIGEFYAKDANRSDKNITTKIVNDEFKISIDTNETFNGIVCSAVVDENENNISLWKKSEFIDSKEENVTFVVTRANKNATIKIEWSSNRGENIECPLEGEFNQTTKNDRFAIRPYKYVIKLDSNITAGKDFNITFQAVDKNGNLVKDYNETNSYTITAKENKNGCITGDLVVNGSFIDGENKAIANYSEVGDINISIEDSCFACGVDGSESDRYIIPATYSNIISKIADINITTSFTSPSIVIDDMNLSNFAEVNVSIKALNGKNQKVINFDKNCYSQDANISFDVKRNDVEAFKGMFDVNGVEFNDSKFESFDKNFTLSKDKFKLSEGNLSIKFNIYKNRAYPVSVLDMNFSKVKVYIDNEKAQSLDKNISFEYLRVYGDDIYTQDETTSKDLYVLVYDNKHSFSNEILLDWYIDENYTKDDIKVLGYTSSYRYDNNISGFEANITKIGDGKYKLNVSNSGKNSVVVVHLKTPQNLWYSRYEDYNDSLNSYCVSHYCIEYVFSGNQTIIREIGSGTFKGSEVNITKPKRKVFGIRIYR